MLKKNAMEAFVYYGNNIYSPLGIKSKKNEQMRKLWANAIDSGFYKKLPNDPIKADEILWKKYKGGN